tara:strand:- start:662 stop:904 length:243 start_codon:yes stop_codon:yes gene_type:complete
MDISQVVALATSMVAGLAGVIVILWRNEKSFVKDRIAQTEAKLEKCEKHHKEATDSIIRLSERVGNLEGYAKRIRGEDTP